MAKTPESRSYRIAVASQHALVSQSVRTALVDRSFDAVAVRWPGGVPLPRNPRESGRYDAALLLGEFERAARLRAATLLVSHVAAPWVVLTDSPRGPLWGAMYAVGAHLVLAATTSLDEVAEVLVRVAEGGAGAPEAERLPLIEAWDRLREERELLAARLATLTPREREVLVLLHAGETAAEIAAVLDVSLSTVRSQIKAILRKLEVSSQLAAVAAYGTALDLRQPAANGGGHQAGS